MNFLVSAICFSLFYYFADTAAFWARVFLVVGITGVLLFLNTFIPSNKVMPSDGYFLFNLGRNKNTTMRRGFWSVSRIQALIAEGSRPRDIPTELFDWVDTAKISNPFVFGTACYQYAYLLDKQELGEAMVLMQTLRDNSNDIPDMMKMSLYCDLLFRELIGECRKEEIDRLYDKKLKDYVKAAHYEINVQLLMYAYARLVLKDAAKAKEHLDLFHKACAMPLQSGFVPGGQELIALIDTIVESTVENEIVN
jgi:hypothetical protein